MVFPSGDIATARAERRAEKSLSPKGCFSVPAPRALLRVASSAPARTIAGNKICSERTRGMDLVLFTWNCACATRYHNLYFGKLDCTGRRGMRFAARVQADAVCCAAMPGAAVENWMTNRNLVGQLTAAEMIDPAMARGREARLIRASRRAQKKRPVPVPGRALGVLHIVLHGTVWHPHAGER